MDCHERAHQKAVSIWRTKSRTAEFCDHLRYSQTIMLAYHIQQTHCMILMRERGREGKSKKGMKGERTGSQLTHLHHDVVRVCCLLSFIQPSLHNLT